MRRSAQMALLACCLLGAAACGGDPDGNTGNDDTNDPSGAGGQPEVPSKPATLATPAAGVYQNPLQVLLSCTSAVASCTTYYTTDGAEPTTASAQYLQPIPINSTTALKFFSVDGEGRTEQVVTMQYTLEPVVEPTVQSSCSSTVDGKTTTCFEGVIASDCSTDLGLVFSDQPCQSGAVGKCEPDTFRGATVTTFRYDAPEAEAPRIDCLNANKTWTDLFIAGGSVTHCQEFSYRCVESSAPVLCSFGTPVTGSCSRIGVTARCDGAFSTRYYTTDDATNLLFGKALCDVIDGTWTLTP